MNDSVNLHQPDAVSDIIIPFTLQKLVANWSDFPLDMISKVSRTQFTPDHLLGLSELSKISKRKAAIHSQKRPHRVPSYSPRSATLLERAKVPVVTAPSSQ